MFTISLFPSRSTYAPVCKVEKVVSELNFEQQEEGWLREKTPTPIHVVTYQADD
jgi:hypothetical protein